jgi:endo-1,4-beta-xylanase
MGIQGHYNIHTFPYEDIRIAIELYASLGLKIQFTEVDLSFYRWNHPQGEIMQQNDPRMMDLFEKAYNKIFSLCNEYRDVLEGITFWGVTDSDTWMLDWPIPGRQNWPLLFNTKGALKSFAQKQISQRMY